MKYASDSHIINMGEITTHKGEAENIKEVTHCFTRLRFTLREPEKADRGRIERVEGVIAVVEGSGQLQVAVGTEVGRYMT